MFCTRKAPERSWPNPNPSSREVGMGRNNAKNTLKFVFFLSHQLMPSGMEGSQDEMSFAEEAGPISDALAPRWVFRWLPLTFYWKDRVPRFCQNHSHLSRMGREKPEGREIKRGLFLTCLIIESWKSMSQNRKYLIKIASVKPWDSSWGFMKWNVFLPWVFPY